MVPQTGILESEKKLRAGVYLFPPSDDIQVEAMVVARGIVYNI